MSKIKHGLFIGNKHHAQNKSFLTDNRITHIVCAASELKPAFPNQFQYLYLQAQDQPSYKINKHFEAATDFIHNAIQNGGAVLVHCRAGISRSSTLTIAYLMKYDRMSYESALALCKEQRSIVNPNYGFRQRLKDYEKQLFKGETSPVSPIQGKSDTKSRINGVLHSSLVVRPQSEYSRLKPLSARKPNLGLNLLGKSLEAQARQRLTQLAFTGKQSNKELVVKGDLKIPSLQSEPPKLGLPWRASTAHDKKQKPAKERQCE